MQLMEQVLRDEAEKAAHEASEASPPEQACRDKTIMVATDRQ